MRDHRKLRVFQQADQLAIDIYAVTRAFARQDPALAAQARRAALSAVTNIVEGSARRTTREYLSFLNIALASAAETQYLVDFAGRLSFMPPVERDRLFDQYSQLLKGVQRLILSLEPHASPPQTAEDARAGEPSAATGPSHSPFGEAHDESA